MNTIAPVILLALAVAVVMALVGCYVATSDYDGFGWHGSRHEHNVGNPYYKPDRPPIPPHSG